ncbi:MAG: hypothetical protein GWN00_28795 [Aliifodinibius sp.]|nr:hypothetical protein [Fodinibius sp.]NIY28655.1 hypothetical protein [Fodinibius sp.]
MRTAKVSLREVVKKEIDLLRASKLDIDDVRTVCLTLGPYRNLTTLTAGMVALHPHCQVLNHAGLRIFGDKRLNFLSNYSEEKFIRFVKYAIYASGRGREGPYGGSVTFSHAFGKQHKLAELYKDVFGDNLLKERIHCLFWKESMATSSYIRERSVDLPDIVFHNEKLRFIMPIRNPLDCAVSNVNFFGQTDEFARYFNLQNRQDVLPEVVEAILAEFVRFLEFKRQHPERFFYYFEHDFGKETLLALANFLNVDPDKQWCKNSLAAFEIKRKYQHPEDLVDLYNRYVEDKFSDYPKFSKKLLRFTRDFQKVA